MKNNVVKKQNGYYTEESFNGALLSVKKTTTLHGISV